jgi:Fur family ferric uptake transcriptional regulator
MGVAGGATPHGPTWATIIVMAISEEQALRALKERGYRMTPQRRAIVGEIMRIRGHISPRSVAGRLRERLPGVNDSTVYRTLELLEELGILAPAHLGAGPEYHHADRDDHVHLVCSVCGTEQQIPAGDLEPMRELIVTKSGFSPDLTHFAISGRCENCRIHKPPEG